MAASKHVLASMFIDSHSTTSSSTKPETPAIGSHKLLEFSINSTRKWLSYLPLSVRVKIEATLLTFCCSLGRGLPARYAFQPVVVKMKRRPAKFATAPHLAFSK
ncbi:hypothetical protein A9K55_004275 [Cordyceps militaris]|uniref:Uncharacterized protein n=1 Tax=Cordyceps militaris TaxID=73501 RepID=A0A2H4SQ60_CORMI|nr:hypothetical protein A9K55_004275 [Cordyceps militaris]